MTSNDQPTPARAEATEGATDPWEALKADIAASYLHERTTTILFALIYRARAAVEAQHRQEIERLTQERDKYRNGFTSSQEQIGSLLAERDALRIQNEQMRQELLDIGAALNDPAENLITTTAQCITRLRAERDALTAQIAALREALDNRFSLLTDCTPLDEKAATVLAARIDELRKVRAALAATEGGTK